MVTYRWQLPTVSNGRRMSSSRILLRPIRNDDSHDGNTHEAKNDERHYLLARIFIGTLPFCQSVDLS
jgi:hypothetical protein